MKTWKNCGHPRSIETARRGRLRYGCKLCDTAAERPARFIGRVYAAAIRPKLHPHYAVENKRLGKRVVTILDGQDPLDRAAYLLLEKHRFNENEVAACMGETVEDVRARAALVRNAVAATEHQNFYKDWSLVQQLIDEGIPEAEVREMICITVNGWFKAKQRGDVRA